jgi:hypothetical protein
MFSIALRFFAGNLIVIEGSGKDGCGFIVINLALNCFKKASKSQAVELGSISKVFVIIFLVPFLF